MYSVRTLRVWGEEKIIPEDRAFFDLISRAAFNNSFSGVRKERDLRIADSSPDAPYDERVDRVIQRVQERVRGLDAARRADLRW